MWSKEMIAKVREDSLEMERRGTLSPEILEMIYDQKLFKLLVPEKFGGNMTHLPEVIKVFEEASYIDGNLGWLITVCSGYGYVAKGLSEEQYKKVFGDKCAALSGSAFPSGRAKQVSEGYLVNGEWKYCSGSAFANFFIMVCLVDNENSSPDTRVFILDRNQVNVLDDWNAFGLKATNSSTVRVNNAFVPNERTMEFNLSVDPFDEPMFKYPFFQFSKAQFAAISLGIARHFLEEANNLADQYKEDWSKTDKYNFIRKKINDAELTLFQAKNKLYESIDHSWNIHMSDEAHTQKHLEEFNVTCEDAARAALQSAQSIFSFLGITAVFETHILNKTWRDLNTACQHGLIVSYRD